MFTALTLADQSKELQTIIDQCKALRSGQQRAVVVFDLDGTLLDNRPRTVAILREAADHWAAAHPKAVEAIHSLDPSQLGYLVTDALRERGVDEALVGEALEVWKQRFFRDDTLLHDVPLSGAVEFARACYEAGGNLAYFTGRDLPNMALGSLASLRDRGFPVGVPGTELVLKPDFETPDLDFKRAVTPEFKRIGHVVATFDNEPGNCNVFHEFFPEATHYLLLTQHAPNPPALAQGVRVIKDFRLG
ncbi:MAG: HAD family hydrolase [Polyangiaceae bacterium]|nr:HAD family hydrolase [Myxococcales bacterium]MCB9585196.1 HAD family hydrolase [Polyangiaceae bacterium]